MIGLDEEEVISLDSILDLIENAVQYESPLAPRGLQGTPLSSDEPASFLTSGILLCRPYRSLNSPPARQALEKDAAIPHRVSLEVRRLHERRTEIQASMREVGADRGTLERDVRSLDVEMSLWCDRLVLCLTEGDYFVFSSAAYEITKLLYTVAVCDQDMLFRNAVAWRSVVECLIEVRNRRVYRQTPPRDSSLLVSWRPLQYLFERLFHTPSRMKDIPIIRILQDRARGVAAKLIEATSEQLDGDALGELWDYFSPRMRPDGSSAIQSLAYFACFAPPFQMVNTAEQRATTDKIVEFLLCESATWHPSNATWVYFTWHFLLKLAPVARIAQKQYEPIALSRDVFAEPLFSSMFSCLRLPVGDDVRRALKVGGRNTLDMLMRLSSVSTMQHMQCVVVHFLPDNTTAPMWNHLRRFIRATELFLRPGGAVLSGAQQLCSLLSGMASEMLHRVDRQRRTARISAPSERELSRHLHISDESVDEFVKLVLPPLISAVYFKNSSVSGDAHHGVQHCCRLAPTVALEIILPYIAAGFEERSTEANTAQLALELLGNGLPELLLGAKLRDAATEAVTTSTAVSLQKSIAASLVHFLHATVTEKLAPLIDSNNMQQTLLTLRIVFQSAIYFDLYGVVLPPLSSPISDNESCEPYDLELTFMTMLMDKLLELVKHLELFPKNIAGAFFCSIGAILDACRGPDTINAVVERVCRACSGLGTPSSVFPLSSLLQVVATRRPEKCWSNLFPTILKTMCDVNASRSEIRWGTYMLVGLIQSRAPDCIFARRDSLSTIIRTLRIRVTNKERASCATALYEAIVTALVKHTGQPTTVMERNGYRHTLVAQIVAPSQVAIGWKSPSIEHLAWCVDMFNANVKEAMDALSDVPKHLEMAVAARDCLFGSKRTTTVDPVMNDAAETASVEAKGATAAAIPSPSPAAPLTTAPHSAADNDEDEVMEERSFIRFTLRWLRRTVDINHAILASTMSPEYQQALEEVQRVAGAGNIPAAHQLSARRHVPLPSAAPIHSKMMSAVPAVAFTGDAIANFILQFMPKLMGSGNFVAVAKPPSMTPELEAFGFAEASSSSSEESDVSVAADTAQVTNVKAIVYCIKLLKSLCNTVRMSDYSTEPYRLLYENWHGQFRSAGGTRYMPYFFWTLSSEVLEEGYRQDAEIVLSDSIRVSIATRMALIAGHHRFVEVQVPARQLFHSLLNMHGVTGAFHAILCSVVEDLKATSVAAAVLQPSSSSPRDDDDEAFVALGTDDEEAQPLAKKSPPPPTVKSPAATASSDVPPPPSSDAPSIITPAAADEPSTSSPSPKKQLDHEVTGLISLLNDQMIIHNFVFLSFPRFIDLVQTLLEFPDVLPPNKDELRKHLFRAICNERLLQRLLSNTELPMVVDVFERAFKVSVSVPSRSARWLELVASMWPSDLRHNHVTIEDATYAVITPSVGNGLLRLAHSVHQRLRTLAWFLLGFCVGQIKALQAGTKVTVSLDDSETPSPPTYCSTLDAPTQAARLRCLKRLEGDDTLGRPFRLGMRHYGMHFLPSSLAGVKPASEAHDIVAVAEASGLSQCDALKGFVASLREACGLHNANEGVRKTWLYRTAQLWEIDSKAYRIPRMHFWKMMARVLGPEQCLPRFRELITVLFADWITGKLQQRPSARRECVESSSESTMTAASSSESDVSIVVLICEIVAASVRATKCSPPNVRLAAQSLLFETIQLCMSRSVTHDVLTTVARCMLDLRDVLTVEAVTALFEHLFQLLVREGDLGEVGGAPGGSQGCIRILTIILQLPVCFSYDIMETVAPWLIAKIKELRSTFLLSSLSQVQVHMASVIRQLLQCVWLDRRENLRTPPAVRLSDQLVDFAMELIQCVAPPSDTPGDLPTLTGPGRVHACKVLVTVWAYPAAPLMRCLPAVIRFFCYALDIQQSETDDLSSNATGSLLSIAFTKMDKPSATAAVEECIRLLIPSANDGVSPSGSSQPIGSSRQAKCALCRMLRVLIYSNLHRVGKYSVMQNITEGALQCMNHADKRVRTEGRTLFAVLIRVASEEQVSVIVKDLLGRLRAATVMPSPGTATGNPELTPPMSPSTEPVTPLPLDSPSLLPAVVAGGEFPPSTVSKSMPPRLALCEALCGAVLADPDGVPPYVPRVLEKLASFARDRNADVASCVKQTMQSWWATHRDKWTFAHKKQFSEQQLNVLMELFNAPSYYI